MELVSVYGVNANSFYCAEKSNNGGGYWQPCGVALVSLDNGTLVTVQYDDTGCGDFGCREAFEIAVDDFCWGWNYSTMDGAYSDDPDKIDAILDSIGGVLGCNPVDILDLAVEAIRTAARYNWHI